MVAGCYFFFFLAAFFLPAFFATFFFAAFFFVAIVLFSFSAFWLVRAPFPQRTCRIYFDPQRRSDNCKKNFSPTLPLQRPPTFRPPRSPTLTSIPKKFWEGKKNLQKSEFFFGGPSTARNASPPGSVSIRWMIRSRPRRLSHFLTRLGSGATLNFRVINTWCCGWSAG